MPTPKYTRDVKKYLKTPEDEAKYRVEAALRCPHVDTVHQEMRCTDQETKVETRVEFRVPTLVLKAATNLWLWLKRLVDFN